MHPLRREEEPEFRGARAPLDAVRDRLDYLAGDLGINAILFMPWTAWPGSGFSWDYDPYQYFSVEFRYANAVAQPAEKLSWLKRLISACHERGYGKLIKLRRAHPALTSNNFYSGGWATWQSRFNSEDYGADAEQGW